MRTHNLIFITVISLFFLPSCQKVIHLDLQNASPQYVIEANITNSPGPYQLRLSQTVNFDKDNVFPGVAGAQVIIADDAGVVDTLVDLGSGVYQTSKIEGIVGHTYHMSVKTADHTFTASSTMPAAVQIDSLYSENANAFGRKIIFMIPTVTDPKNVANFYNFTIVINDHISKGIYASDDVFFDGQKINLSLFPDGPRAEEDRIKDGDSVTIRLTMIDEKVYNYFFSLGETISQNAASPSNPVSNITGGALGYFSAGAITERGYKVPN